MNSIFQPTANCQFTICLTTGVHLKEMSSTRVLASLLKYIIFQIVPVLRRFACNYLQMTYS